MRSGIVHRDLKPANLFCVRRTDGQLSIKVLDFGISKMLDASASAPGSFTRTTAVMGSPMYMSPEQMRSAKDVDARGDIWALGMILFELMTGRPAFQADSMMELVVKVTNDPTPPIRTLRPDVPAALEEKSSVTTGLAQCMPWRVGGGFCRAVGAGLPSAEVHEIGSVSNAYSH